MTKASDIVKMIEPVTNRVDSNKDWEAIIEDNVISYLRNPLSGKTGTEEEKQALFEFIQTPTYSYLKRMKVDSPLWFEIFINFDISHKTYKGKKRITMELKFDPAMEKVPEDYDGDNEILKENIGVYFRIWNINLYKRNCCFNFRRADDCSAEFIRNGGQILNKENVWKAYTKISCEMSEIKKGNVCQHVNVYRDSKMIDLCCCPKWTKDSKCCIMCSHNSISY